MNSEVASSSVIRRMIWSEPLGQADEALDLLRHANERVHRLAVLDARQLHRHGEAEIGNERERMRRIDRQRRQQRKDMGEEAVLEPGALGLLQVCRPRPARRRRRQAPAAAPAIAAAGRRRAARPPRRCAKAARSASARPGFARRCPARTWPLRPATRTMKNSSRLLAEMDRKRTRSSSGWLSLAASSSTRRLKCSQDNSRLMKRCGCDRKDGSAAGSGVAESAISSI